MKPTIVTMLFLAAAAAQAQDRAAARDRGIGLPPLPQESRDLDDAKFRFDQRKSAQENQAARAELAAQFRETRIVAITADVSDEKAVKRYVDETLHAFGKIDGLYNNAGIEGPQASLTQYDLDAFKKVLDINLMGVYYGMRHVIPVMQKQQYGRIVNVSSVAGITGNRGQVNYSAAKGALHAASKSLALELASRGITVNAVAPGIIATDMIEGSFDADTIKKLVPMQRAGKPEEVASLVAFLASEQSAYISGQVISINGAMV